MSAEDNKADRRTLVHRVLGGFNPARDRRARGTGHPLRVLAARACRGRDEVRGFATKFRAAFPDLNFWGTADLIAEGDYVVGQWEGGGTQTGDAFDDMPIGYLAGRHRQVDALHRHHDPEGRERPDHRGTRPRLRCHRGPAARPDHGGITEPNVTRLQVDATPPDPGAARIRRRGRGSQASTGPIGGPTTSVPSRVCSAITRGDVERHGARRRAARARRPAR